MWRILFHTLNLAETTKSGDLTRITTDQRYGAKEGRKKRKEVHRPAFCQLNEHCSFAQILFNHHHLFGFIMFN